MNTQRHFHVLWWDMSLEPEPRVLCLTAVNSMHASQCADQYLGESLGSIEKIIDKGDLPSYSRCKGIEEDSRSNRAYVMRKDENQIVYVQRTQYENYAGLTMVYFECQDGSNGAMDRRTFLQFYRAKD